MDGAEQLEVEEAGVRGVELGVVALDEPVDAALQRLLGAAGDEQDPDAGDGLLAQRGGDADQPGDGAEVVVGAGHDPAAREVDRRRQGQQRAADPGPGQQAAAAERAERDQQRRADHRPPERDRAGARVDLGKALGEGALAGLVEEEGGRVGVVVGEDDERLGPLRIAGAGDDVGGRPLAHQQPPQQPRAVDRVLGDCGGGAGRDDRSEQPRAPAAPQRCQARADRGGAEHAHRRRVARERGLLLDSDLTALGPQALGDPLRRLALAGRAGAALDRREVGDRCVEIRLRRHRRHSSGRPATARRGAPRT